MDRELVVGTRSFVGLGTHRLDMFRQLVVV